MVIAIAEQNQQKKNMHRQACRYKKVWRWVMRLFRRVAHAFIMTFGITQPRPSQEQLATIFIMSLLAVALFAAAGIGAILLHALLGG